MWYAAHRKVNLFEVADFDRRVVKNVEVFSAKRVCLAADGRQARSNFPALNWNDMKRRRRLNESVEVHQQGGVIPERVIRIQFVCADRQLIRINAILGAPLGRAVGRNSPRSLVYF